MIVVFVVDTSPSMAAAANSSGSGDRGTGVIGKQIFFMLKYVICCYFPVGQRKTKAMLCPYPIRYSYSGNFIKQL